MLLALCLFAAVYLLMLFFQQYRPWIALGGAAVFLLLGGLGVYDFTLTDAACAVDFNVLLMMAGTMGTVALFIESKMPLRLAEELISRVPNVKWAISMLALFAGIISAFVDNVATVLMIAPVGLAISRKLKISPEMHGRPGIFWGVELGALVSLGILLFLFRHDSQPIHAVVETEVEDPVPTYLLLLTVALLVVASFLPEPDSGIGRDLYEFHSGLICVSVCLFGVLRACFRSLSLRPAAHILRELDCDTLLLLFGLFILIEGVKRAGLLEAAAELFCLVADDDPFRLYTLIVVVSVVLSAFIDNIPYVATMLPVVQSMAAHMNNGVGMPPELFYFGLLTGATLGGNLTPIGASANIAAIGILRRNGETVQTRDFLRIGVPFTLAAVLTGYLYLWFVWR